MYDELEKQLRYCADSDNYCSECKYRGGSSDGSKICLDLLMLEAADAIEERDRYALTLQHEMMAEAESHIASVERLNKQVEELQKQVAHWQRELVKSMCGETLAELEKPRWIPVTERLPSEELCFYSCYTDKGVIVECLWTNNRTGLGPLGEWGWRFMDVPSHQRITHWMPLPEPPEPPKEET